MTNQRILLVKRPDGAPTPDVFARDCQPIPDLEPGDYLIRVCLLSMDPALVGRMRDEANYIDPAILGEVMHCYGIGQVIESKNRNVRVGEVRLGRLDMQEYSIFEDPDETAIINLGLTSEEHYLSVVGITGATAYFSLLDIGNPKRGETILISSAASSVASVVAQMARRQGLRTVGIVSTEEKANLAKVDWGYEEVVSYRGKSIDVLSAEIATACPHGVDIYYDNTSGDISEAALDHFNDYARHIVIGRMAISHLADTRQDTGRRDNSEILRKRITKQGFVLLDYKPVFRAAFLQLAKWVNRGELKSKCDIANGIGQAETAFFRMLSGHSQGKQLLRLAEIDHAADPAKRWLPQLLTSNYFPTERLVQRIRSGYQPHVQPHVQP